jgi:transcriptional regulator with XRE-family HTH domain
MRMRMTNLRNLRDALGWSREELARRAGVSAKTIEAHEIGSPEDVYKSISTKLAIALGCDESNLFFLEEYALTHNLVDPETLSSLETAKSERAVLQESVEETIALSSEQITGITEWGKQAGLSDSIVEGMVEPYKQTIREVLQEMAFDDAALEMRPTKTLTALQRLEQQVQTYGRKNHLGHKQLGDIVLVGGALLELAWDVTSNDEPDAVTESRAEEILNELLEQSNPKTAVITQALSHQEAVQ